MTLKTEHFYVVSYVPPRAGLPAHVAHVRFAERPEVPESQQNAWAGCTGCAGTSSPALCKRLKASAAHDCSEGLIYVPDLEFH